MSKGRAMRVLAMSGMGEEQRKYGGARNAWGDEAYDDRERDYGMRDQGMYAREGRNMGGRQHRGRERRAENDHYGEREGRMNGGMRRGHEWDDEEDGGWAGRFRPRTSERDDDDEEEDEVKFDEHKAKKWVAGMHNSDGTTGEHFKPEIAEQLRASMCPQCDKTEFWAAMNMMYSDYCDVAKKMNIDRPEYYGHMAKAFLMDKDAGEGKLAKYMKYVAGK